MLCQVQPLKRGFITIVLAHWQRGWLWLAACKYTRHHFIQSHTFYNFSIIIWGQLQLCTPIFSCALHTFSGAAPFHTDNSNSTGTQDTIPVGGLDSHNWWIFMGGHTGATLFPYSSIDRNTVCFIAQVPVDIIPSVLNTLNATLTLLCVLYTIKKKIVLLDFFTHQIILHSTVGVVHKGYRASTDIR